jgi:NAD(P)-dependent dehydrogenase (short-subunit alcohol dehydrogenase family)
MLADKNILITGSSSGIGKQIAIDCSLNNSNNFLCARRLDRLLELRKILKNPENQNVFQIDLSIEIELDELVNRLPNLDGIVLNAGVVQYRPISLITSQNIRDVFNVNFESNVLLIQKLLKAKKINKGASIVIISSISTRLGVPGTALYSASKAALTSFSKVLASELSTKSIRVNTISPGLVNTEIYQSALRLSDNSSSNYLLGVGDVTDVSNQVLFLLSNNSKWITGTDIILDGGYLLS